MSVDQGIGLVAIVVTVLLAFLAVKKIRKSKNQKQVVKGGGISIQSGRDTKLGQ